MLARVKIKNIVIVVNIKNEETGNRDKSGGGNPKGVVYVGMS